MEKIKMMKTKILDELDNIIRDCDTLKDETKQIINYFESENEMTNEDMYTIENLAKRINYDAKHCYNYYDEWAWENIENDSYECPIKLEFEEWA